METIYSFIYRAGQKAEELWQCLVRRHKKRRTLRSRPSRDTIKDRVSIDERPDDANDRSTLGHWEADLIICQRTRPVLVLHECKTRVTLAARLTGKDEPRQAAIGPRPVANAETASVIMNIFRRLDPKLRQSVTFDNDTVFARHSWLREARDMATYFCDAYALQSSILRIDCRARPGRREESKMPPLADASHRLTGREREIASLAAPADEPGRCLR